MIEWCWTHPRIPTIAEISLLRDPTVADREWKDTDSERSENAKDVDCFNLLSVLVLEAQKMLFRYLFA